MARTLLAGARRKLVTDDRRALQAQRNSGACGRPAARARLACDGDARHDRLLFARQLRALRAAAARGVNLQCSRAVVMLMHAGQRRLGNTCRACKLGARTWTEILCLFEEQAR